MADFSLTTLFVVPTGAVVPTAGTSTQNLGAGAFGAFKNDYTADTAANIAAAPYFYFAQGRAIPNNYLQGTKRSDKIKGCAATANCNANITEIYKVAGCATATTQITDITNWTAPCGDILTLTIRAHSSYLDTLYFNGLTRSVTVQAACCGCPADPCTPVGVSALIDQFVAKLNQQAPGNNPDNIHLSQFFTFTNVGGTTLRITGLPLTKYAQPCDVAAFPWEYDRMWFRTFVYEGPATTADFIVADSCNIVATSTITQRSSYPTGSADEVKQLEKNYYSYQAGYLKHLYRMVGYNENFESYVIDGTTYDTYYIKFNEYDRSTYQWGDYIPEDEAVIIANPVLSAGAVVNAAITAYLDPLFVALSGAANIAAITINNGNVCPTTTTTTTGAGTTTTTTSLTTNIP